MNSSTLFGTLLLLAAIGIGYWVYRDYSSRARDETLQQEQVQKGFLSTRKDYNDKLEDIKQRREEIVVQIDRLDERKQAAGQKLKDAGIATADDLANNTQAQLQFSNLKRLMADVEKFRNDLLVYDQAIGRIEAALADLDRQELKNNAGISDQQARQLDTIIKDIDDRLIEPESPLEQLETQEILDDILGKQPTGKQAD